MRRLTVVQLLPALESGGVERSTLEIADALVRAGHRAVVVSAGGRLVPTLQASGAEHVTLDIGRKSLLTLRHVPALRRLLADVGTDIVHARSRLPAWIGLSALRGMPAPLRSIKARMPDLAWSTEKSKGAIVWASRSTSPTRRSPAIEKVATRIQILPEPILSQLFALLLHAIAHWFSPQEESGLVVPKRI